MGDGTTLHLQRKLHSSTGFQARLAATPVVPRQSSSRLRQRNQPLAVLNLEGIPPVGTWQSGSVKTSEQSFARDSTKKPTTISMTSELQEYLEYLLQVYQLRFNKALFSMPVFSIPSLSSLIECRLLFQDFGPRKTKSQMLLTLVNKKCTFWIELYAVMGSKACHIQSRK